MEGFTPAIFLAVPERWHWWKEKTLSVTDLDVMVETSARTRNASSYKNFTREFSFISSYWRGESTMSGCLPLALEAFDRTFNEPDFPVRGADKKICLPGAAENYFQCGPGQVNLNWNDILSLDPHVWLTSSAIDAILAMIRQEHRALESEPE